MTLDAIKQALDTRNIVNTITYATPERWHVNTVQTGKQQRVMMVTCNGKAVREYLLEGDARLPELLLLYRLRKEYRCDGYEGSE